MKTKLVVIRQKKDRDGARCSRLVWQVVHLKDEITAELKTSHQGFTNAETEEMSVLTKTTEEKTVRQMSLQSMLRR